MAEQLLKGRWFDLGPVLPVSYDGKPFRSAGQLPEKLFQGANSPSAVEGVAGQQYEIGGGSIDCGQQFGVQLAEAPQVQITQLDEPQRLLVCSWLANR